MAALKKVFIQCLFGRDPFPWTEQYLQNIRRMEPYGWSLKVFTPHPLAASSNIEIIPMTLGEYDSLVLKHCGVNPSNFINDRGVPNKLTSDHYPAQGWIFQDYLHDADYICITNWDCAYGRIDRFLTDIEIEGCDVWSDDPAGFNGIFTLMRNDKETLNLFRMVEGWEQLFVVHQPCAFDEIRFTEALNKADQECWTRWGHPLHFPLHSYDRLVMHRPTPRLYFEDDGALIEWYEDRTHPPTTKRHYGREIPLFHFSKTKRWPIGEKPA